MKKILLNLLFATMSVTAIAQVTSLQFPKDKQLYPRDKVTSIGSAVVSGKVNNAASYFQMMRVRLYRDNVLVNTYDQPLVFSSGIASYGFMLPIKAELFNYTVELYGINGTTETLLKKAVEVVSGDAYIINGQSNAVANMYLIPSSIYVSPFIRTYGSPYPDASASADQNWYAAEGDGLYTAGAIGQWGLKTAKNIVDNQKIPVAVINGAVGGTDISKHLRNNTIPSDMNTIYGRLLSRVTGAGLKTGIRGLFWHQGESDAALGRTIAQYKALWNQLKSSWATDYPSIEHFFTFQIRMGCGVTQDGLLNIVEAQRQIASGNTNIHIVSTNGTFQNTDNCHYPFLLGYDLFADRLILQVNKFIYKKDPILMDILPADITSAKLVAPVLLELTFANVTNGALVFDPTTFQDFRFEGLGKGTTILSGVGVGNKIYLVLGGTPLLPSAISYFGHQGVGLPYIAGLSNAALCFANVNITPAPLFLTTSGTPELTEAINLIEEQQPELAAAVKESIANATQELVVSPNPSSNEASVTLPAGATWDNINVIDITGRQVMQKEINNSDITDKKSSLDVSNLEVGQYFVTLSGPGRTLTTKLVVQH